MTSSHITSAAADSSSSSEALPDVEPVTAAVEGLVLSSPTSAHTERTAAAVSVAESSNNPSEGIRDVEAAYERQQKD